MDGIGPIVPDDNARWFLYVLWSETLGRTYVGITVDLDRRLAQHNGAAPGGAKSTRSGRPWRTLARAGPFADRREASRAEYRVKRARGTARVAVTNALTPTSTPVAGAQSVVDQPG